MAKQNTTPNTIHISSFHGMDRARNTAANSNYGLGNLAINLGRKNRRPLESRTGLRPVTTSNEGSQIGGITSSIAAMPVGDRLHILIRTSGGKLVVAKDVAPKAYVST